MKASLWHILRIVSSLLYSTCERQFQVWVKASFHNSIRRTWSFPSFWIAFSNDQGPLLFCDLHESKLMHILRIVSSLLYSTCARQFQVWVKASFHNSIRRTWSFPSFWIAFTNDQGPLLFCDLHEGKLMHILRSVSSLLYSTCARQFQVWVKFTFCYWAREFTIMFRAAKSIAC